MAFLYVVDPAGSHSSGQQPEDHLGQVYFPGWQGASPGFRTLPPRIGRRPASGRILSISGRGDQAPGRFGRVIISGIFENMNATLPRLHFQETVQPSYILDVPFPDLKSLYLLSR